MKLAAIPLALLILVACGTSNDARVDPARPARPERPAQVQSGDLAARVAELESRVKVLNKAALGAMLQGAVWANLEECVSTTMPHVSRDRFLGTTRPRYLSFNIEAACNGVMARETQPPPRVAAVLEEALNGRAMNTAEGVCDLLDVVMQRAC